MVEGRAVAAWLQSDGVSDINAYASEFIYGSWTTPTLLEQSGPDASLPVVTIDADGSATALWQQSNGTEESVYEARFTPPPPPYVVVTSGVTWRSIANTLYGIDSAQAGDALRAALGNPTLTIGSHLSGFPPQLVLPIIATVPAYYTVRAGDTWASITQTIYGNSSAGAIAALQTALGNPTLATGVKLTVPQTLTYSAQSASANGAALSTSDVQTTTTGPSLSSYGLDVAAVTGAAPTSPVVNVYRNSANQVVGTLHADGSFTSYSYTYQGQLASSRHVAAPVAPEWSQDFSVDASGYSALESGYSTLEDGALIVTSHGDAQTWSYRTSLGQHIYDFDDHIVFRAELNSGEGPSGRHFNIGAQAVDESRWHGVQLEGMGFYAIDKTASGEHSTFLGNVDDDRDYVVEVATHAGGSTLFVYKKGADRTTGFRHDLTNTDWGDVQGFFQTLGSQDGNSIDIRLDNLSESTASGELVGPWIAAESAEDLVTYYDDSGRVTGTLRNGEFTTYGYDAQGRLVSYRVHDEEAPIAPIWTQDFSHDTRDFIPLYSGIDTRENSGMTVTSGVAANSGWRTSFGQRVNDFVDHYVYRGEVTTGSNSDDRQFNFGLMNFSSTRVHSAFFGDGKVYVNWYNNGWQEAELGAIEDNTTYVVEVTTDATGSTLYVWEKGKDRSSGYSDHRTYTDWDTTRLFFETHVGPTQGVESVRLDNLSIATQSGGLVGSLIAVEDSQDTVRTGYTIPAGATWRSIANTLYGVNSAAAGAALQAALGDPPLTEGTQLTELPLTLSVTNPPTTYALDGLGLTGGAPASPVVQTYFDEADRISGTLHADGSFTSYTYGVHGQRTSATRHAAPPVSPLWSQDFSQNADGFEPLISGVMTHEGGSLAVRTGDMAVGWQMSFGTHTHDFDDHVVFRQEVTTGTDDTSDRNFKIGAENLDETRRHAANFLMNTVSVSYYDNGWKDVLLGDIDDNTTYVVEVVTHAQGSTLYVYEKGTDRAAGYRHDLAFADWGDARSFFETFTDTGIGPSTMRIDNVSESSASGALVGPWVATESAADVRVYYDDAGRVAGTRANGMYTSYNYDALGQLVSLRHHDSASAQPLWSQDFSHDASGLTQIGPGLATHENGGLTVSAGPDPGGGGGWQMSFGWNSYDFNDHLVYRGEVNTGSDTSTRTFGLGAIGTTSMRQHEALFSGGHVYAVYFDQDYQQVDLGAIDDDTTYVVETVMEATGSTLYVYEKGTNRASGYSDHRSFTDWGDVRIFYETYIGEGQGESDVRLDNLAIAPVAGPLIGSFVPANGAQDTFTEGYTIPAGATWQSIAQALYGVNSAAAGSALEIALGHPPLTQGTLLTDLPATLSLPAVTVSAPTSYTIPSGATWQSIASALYGINSAEAGEALRDAMNDAPLTVGTRLINLPVNLSIATEDTAAAELDTGELTSSGSGPYYLVPSGATWQSVANTLYGVNNPEAGAALQTVLGNPALTTGAHLTGLPATLDVPVIVDAPAFYTVQEGDTWASITQAIYGTSDAAAIAVLQAALGNPTLTEGLKLTVPETLLFGEGGGEGTSTLYLQTDVTDALGHVTTYEQDEDGRLTAVLSPTVGGTRLETRYGYDEDGNVTSIAQDPDGLNRVTALSYDDNGNLLSSRDDLGNTVTRTYNSNNQLLTETHFIAPDPDGGGSGQPSGELKTRYAYDSENHLRFVISADGRVTEHRYNTAGERTLTLKYTGALYTATNFAESDLSTWASARDLTQLERLEYAYDFRDNLESITAYTSTGSTGAGTGTPSITRFVYDQRGQLLQTIDARDNSTPLDEDNANLPYATTYTYDGLGRLLTSTQWNSSTSLTTTINDYDDANRRTTTTFDNGLITTRLYNNAGELISVANGTSSASGVFGTTTYAYDADGRLRIVTDPLGTRVFHFYDDAGREIGIVDGDGSLTEFIYDDASHLIKTIRYAELIGSTVLASLVDSNGDPVDVPFSDVRAAADGNPDHDRITRSVYDAGGQLLITIDEAGAVTKFLRDAAGRISEEVRYATPVTIARTVDQVLEGDLTLTTSADDRHTRRFYDKDSNLVGVIDAEGYLTEFVYSPAGHLTQQIAYATRTTGTGTLEALRPALDNETATTPEQDIVSYFFYDGQGRRIGALDGEHYFTETVYDVAGQVTQAIRYDRQLTYTPGTSNFATLKAAATTAPAPKIHTQAYEYDGAGRVVEETDFEGTVTTYKYDDVGNLISSTRAFGTTQARTTEKRYDELGRVKQELTAQGHALITGGMSQQDIDDIWDRYGVTYEYDNAGRRISATVRPDDMQTNKTRYFYDVDGRLRFEVNQLGEVKESRYDALGQLTDSIAYTNRIDVTGLNGGLVSTTLTSRVNTAADAAKDAHSVLTYTKRGQLSSATTAEASNTTYTYNTFGDQSGSVQALTGVASLEHTYSYDKRGLLTNTHWDPNGFDTTEVREYDGFGRLTHVTDANGNVRRMEYDRLGRTVVMVDALNAERVTTYDGFSRTLTTSDALGNVTEYAYDDSARSMTMTTPEGVAVTTTHNRHGQTVTVVAAGLTTQYSYDLNGQLTGVSDNLGTLESRTYDRAGRQLTSTDARSTATTFEYDAANRVLTRTVDDGGLALTTAYGYDGQGRVTSVTDPEGVVTATTYDADGRVVQVAVDPGTGHLNLRTTYDYDLAGRLITVTEGAGTAEQRVTEYGYDKLGRRFSELVDPTGLALRTNYTYDDNGNLVRKVDPAGNETIYVYDAENRQRFVIDATFGLTETMYDANGRVTATKRYGQYIDASDFPEVGPISLATVQGAEFLYNDGPVAPADRIERYVYDADGRQVFTIDAMGGVTRKEYDDRGNVIRQVMYSQRIPVTDYNTVQQVAAALALVNDNNVSNDRESRTVYDLRGRARYTIDGLGGVLAYVYDAVGNVASKTEFATPYTGAATLTALDGFATGSAGSQDRTTRMWYDAANRLRFTLDAEGYLREKRYDDVGRVTADILYAAKPATIASSATLANVQSAAAGAADASDDQRTATIYDAAGRATSVADASGAADTYEYDAVGNRISFTNKAGATWTYVYDKNRRLLEEHSPQVEIVTVDTIGHWNNNGYGYGGYGGGYNTDLTSSTSTGSLITRMTYDALGNVTQRTEAYGRSNERSTLYFYDELGRQTGVIHPAVGHFEDDFWASYGGTLFREQVEQIEGDSSFTDYDALGNAVRNQDERNGFTQRIYDVLGRVRYVIDAEQYVTEYRYDTFGNQIEMIRYANQFDPNGEVATDELVSEELAATLLDPDASVDRAIHTQYDRVNRAVQVTQPETLVFLPNAGQAGGQLITATPTTVNEYNAQGQLRRQSQLVDPTANTWATTYFYYDERGQKTAQIDALGYVTTYEYDAAGNEIRTVEYARALEAGHWSLADYDDPPVTTLATSPDDPAGYDRIRECVYDRLNRKVSERLVGMVTSETPTGADHVTAIDYDAVGNQTRITTNGVATYIYYDVLGRQIAIAAPAGDRGDGTFLTPLTRMRRDAFGNLVEQIVYARGADTATLSALTFTADAADRKTRFLVDSMNHVIETQDPEGNKRFASYDFGGDLALEWQHVSNQTAEGPDGRIQTMYDYDRLGRQTFSRRRAEAPFEGESDPSEIIDYNGFGEMVRRQAFDQEIFEYDQNGRLWRTNTGDGVWKVYLYDLAGHATAEIRSREINLSTLSEGDIAALTSQRMRTETRYDLLGRVVEQRSPSFAPASPENELDVIGGPFQIDDDVQAPSNPDAVYRLVNQEIDFGFDNFTYTLPVLDPGASAAEGGGYHYVTPTTGNPGGWVQDTNYHLVTGRYLHWARPPEISFGFGLQAMTMSFEYRAHGDSGAWTSLPVVSLPNGEVGVALGSLPTGQFDYRVTYTRANQLQSYALATGTITVTSTTASIVDTTLATLAADNITPTSITTTVPVNTEFLDANLRIGGFSGMNPLDGFVYRRVVNGSLVSYIVDRFASAAQGGGYYLTASGYVQKPDYDPQSSRSVRWDPPVDDDLVATFEVWNEVYGEWNALAVQKHDIDATTFEYVVPIGFLDDGDYQFRITYRPPYDPQSEDPIPAPVATAVGTFHITEIDAGGTLELDSDPPDNAGTVATVSNRPGGSNDIESEIVSSSGHDTISSEGIVFTGTNDVLVKFPSLSGAVRVEMDYWTRDITPEDDEGPDGEGWPAELRTISLVFSDASAAAEGLHLIWNDIAAPSTGGGISRVDALRVYSLDGDGDATLRAASEDFDFEDIGGTTLSWDAPWNTSIDATFQVRRVGETTWQALTISRVGKDYSVDVQALGAGEFEYRVVYEQDGIVRAETQGNFVSSGGSISNVFEDPGSSAFPIEPVAPVSGMVTSPVEFTVVDSSEPVVTATDPDGGPLTMGWDGQNQIDLQWADVGAVPVRVVVDYVTGPRYAYNYSNSPPPHFEETPALVPGYHTSRQQDFTSGAATGTSMIWSDDDQDPYTGGIASVQRIRVYTEVSGVWVLKYDRDSAAPVGGASVSWPTPDNEDVDATFRIREVGTTTWQTISVATGANGLLYADLDTLDAGDYEYEITHSITENSVTTVLALTTGELTIPTASSGAPKTLSLDVTQHNATFDRGANDFGPVSWDAEEIAWSRAPASGDSILVRTRVVGTTTWAEQTISGSGPDFVADAAAAANQALEFEILYTHSGQSTPYSAARGTLNSTVSTNRVPSNVKVTSQSALQQSNLFAIDVTDTLGTITWTTPADSLSHITFRYQLSNGTWQTLIPTGNQDDGYYVEHNSLPPGVYRYEVIYKRPTESLPYAIASGSMTIGGSPDGGGLTLENRTQFSATTTVSTSANVPTRVQTFDRWGNVLSTSDALGNTTHYRYDQMGHVVRSEQPTVAVVDTSTGAPVETTAAPVTENMYDLNGRLVETRDANGNVNGVTYNAAGQIIEETHADGGEKHYVYDAFGNQVLVTDELGFRTRNTYDGANNLVSVERELTTNGLGSPSTSVTYFYEYDQAGRRTGETDGMPDSPEGLHMTAYQYDARSNVVSRFTPRSFETRYRYDHNGNKTREQDANGNVQTWQYDDFNRLLSHTDLGGTTTRYEYDYAGLLVRQTSDLGQNLEYQYDTAGQLIRIVDRGVATPSADVVSSNRLTEYGYDLAGRRIVERTIVDNVVQQDSRISYDALGRMVEVEDPDFTVDYSYDAAGNRTHISAQYFNHNGTTPTNEQSQDLWYTYDEMNRVLVTQGVFSGGVIDVTAVQGSQLTYNLRGERVSAYTGGEHMEYREEIQQEQDIITYSKVDGLFTETYGYDGLGRLVWTEQAVPTTTVLPNGTTHHGITSIRTNTRQYDAASRETLDETFAIDGDGPVSSLTTTTRLSTYDPDGRLWDQSTLKNNVMQFVLRYGDAEFVPEAIVPISNPLVAHALSSFSNSSGARTLRRRTVVTSQTPGSGVPQGYARIPAHWETTGFDRTGTLRGYKVEIYRPNDGKYLYATEHKLEYRLGDSYQLINEKADSFTTVHNVSLPHHGETTRTYNVNGELVQYSDIVDANKNRYFVNDASGKALLAVTGNFNGKSGNSVIGQAIGQAIARAGNTAKAQYFFSANGQSIGSFGQLTNEDGDFEANFDVNFTPVSEQFTSQPSQVIAQAGDTLRAIAARVFGDPSLWYVIAEENGLTDPDAALEEGKLLRIPNRVLSLSNTSSSFKPFDVSDAIGDTTPTQPTPKKKKHGGLRGFLTTIAVIVVAVVVTFLLTPYATAALGNFLGYGAAAAAGSAASQGVAIAAGVQDEFSWGQVGTAFLSAGILQGTDVGSLAGKAGLGEFGTSVLQGAINSTVNQGVSIALGLQDSFSWSAVALGAVSTGVASETAKWAGGQVTGSAAVQKFVTNVAASAGSVLVRTAFGGKIDTTAVLADVFGTALGNSIADQIRPVPKPTLETEIQNGIEETRARNEAELMGMAAPTLTLDEDVRHRQFQMSLQQEIERNLSSNPEFSANLPMPAATYQDTVTARRGDSISTILGTSSPVAVEAFMRANGLSNSTIQAGRTYNMPGTAEYAASNGELGQAILNQDNSRLAAIAEARHRDSVIAAGGDESNTFSGSMARAQLARKSANPFAGPGNSEGPDLKLEWSHALDAATLIGEAYGNLNRVSTLTETIDYVVRTSASAGSNTVRAEASMAFEASVEYTTKLQFSKHHVAPAVSESLEQSTSTVAIQSSSGTVAAEAGSIARTTVTSGSINPALATTARVVGSWWAGGLLNMVEQSSEGEYNYYEPTARDEFERGVKLVYDFGSGAVTSYAAGTLGLSAGALTASTGYGAPVAVAAGGVVALGTSFVVGGAFKLARPYAISNAMRAYDAAMGAIDALHDAATFLGSARWPTFGFRGL
jgi:YD repeat-containing protein